MCVDITYIYIVRTKITLSNRYIQTFYCTKPHFTNIFLIKNKTDIPTFYIDAINIYKTLFRVIMGNERTHRFRELISLFGYRCTTFLLILHGGYIKIFGLRYEN